MVLHQHITFYDLFLALLFNPLGLHLLMFYVGSIQWVSFFHHTFTSSRLIGNAAQLFPVEGNTLPPFFFSRAPLFLMTWCELAFRGLQCIISLWFISLIYSFADRHSNHTVASKGNVLCIFTLLVDRRLISSWKSWEQQENRGCVQMNDIWNL